MNRHLLKLLLLVCLFYSCDQLEDDLLSDNIINQNPIINNNDIYAIEGQSTIIDVLGNPQENAVITLVNNSNKAKHQWINNRFIEYKPNKGAGGKDYLIFQIETNSSKKTDSIFIQIGDSSVFNTDSCMVYAREDLLILDADLKGSVNLLANDELCNYTLQDIFLVQTPQNGTATISGNGLLQYIGKNNQVNHKDSLIYRANLISNDSASADKSILAFVKVLSSNDSICTPVFKTGIDSVSIAQSIIELNVLSDDFLCDWQVTELRVFNFSLGNVQVTDSNSILFEPQMLGFDSIRFEVTFENGQSFIAHHLISVIEEEMNICDSLVAVEDSVSLGFPNQAVIDIDVLLNDTYCAEQPLPEIYIADSLGLQYGVAEVIKQSGYPIVRYVADSAAWGNNISESISYRICQGQYCSESLITVSN
ncbi:hypothetical protein GCM10011506_47080 [Marivirga lumbricoides]|uniref:BACON domain-containing protein n=1 Tax=Marivirga lumbricoides TaxID=1046115 RepID=A0ABQ1N773_9BACT|nr:hypothetical protein GCM10011506_47080 [Marivirga lumbricoides]